MTTQATPEPIAVIGATGQQGGAVIDALLSSGVPVRALVRDLHAPAAQRLASRGVQLAWADQEDEASLQQALDRVAALFFHTTFADADGAEGEVRRGITVAAAAARAGVPRVVYSSVGGAERHTGIPHFDSKYRVEERLRALLPTQVIRPTFFMENLVDQLHPDQTGTIVLRLPMPPDIPVQMIAVRDIGTAAAAVLRDPRAINADTVEIAGDERTMAEVAHQVATTFSVPARFEELPLDALGSDQDLKAMFRWFTTLPAYQADLTATRSLVPDLLNISEWLHRQNSQQPR